MRIQGIVKLLRPAADVAIAIMAVLAFIVLVSDVAEPLALWETALVKAGAFAVLVAALLRTPFCQERLRELR